MRKVKVIPNQSTTKDEVKNSQATRKGTAKGKVGKIQLSD
jgi:hypothetical protein